MHHSIPLLSRLAGILALAIPLISAPARGAEAGSLTVVDRVVSQGRLPRNPKVQDYDRGAKDARRWQFWQVDYRLRNDGPTELMAIPAEVSATVEGWVSNSRIPSHTSPRRASQDLSGTSGLSATAEVIASRDEVRRCREHATLRVWVPTEEVEPPDSPGTLRVAPGGIVRVRLRLEHQHFIYGPYDPLLGLRSFELHLGTATLRDTLPLDREQHFAQAEPSWPLPPADRLDTRQYISAPHSLHLEAHVPGNHQYRYPEQPVRYATRMRLSYWYLIAPGTRGECRARVSQYKDIPPIWRPLSDGNIEESLSTVGRWVHVERIFRTESEATTLALDFRIVGSENIGEMWIDDVSLEPVTGTSDGP